MVFDKEALRLDEVVKFIETDFVDINWIVGVCRCGAEEGPYAGTIFTSNYAVLGFELRLDEGLVPITQGWRVHAHAANPADALSNCYRKALEQNV